MNRLIICILVAVLSCACHTVTTKTTLYDKIINRTNKEIYYFIDTNIGSRNIAIASNDSSTIEMEYMSESTESILAYERFYHQVEYTQICIYNLNDTTSIDRAKIKESLESDSLLLSNFDNHIEGTPSNFNVYNMTIVDNYLITYFKKDYSMLERFKEYYQK